MSVCVTGGGVEGDLVNARISSPLINKANKSGAIKKIQNLPTPSPKVIGSAPWCSICVREHILILTGLPMANVRSRDAFRVWLLASIWPPCRIFQGLDKCEQPLC